MPENTNAGARFDRAVTRLDEIAVDAGRLPGPPGGWTRAHRDDLARDVARLWPAVEADGWMQGDPFPRDLSDALDRLATAYGAID